MIKQITIFLIVIGLASTGYSDAIRASDTVLVAIESAQNNNEARLLNCVDITSVEKSKRHSYSKKNLIKLFKSIDLKKVKFKDVNAVKVVHMITPLNLQFEILKITRENVKPTTTYRIIGIHP